MQTSTSTLLDDLHYKYGPPISVVLCSFLAQILAIFGTTDEDISWSIFGNVYSWTVVTFMVVWALASLLIPGKEYHGPTTSFGFTPKYRANGFQYFLVTLILFSCLLFFRPQTALELTKNFPQILATCNIIAYILCIFLLVKGKSNPECNEKLEDMPIIYEFYRGMEVHPVILGTDVKQLTNCRFGLMAWLLLVISFIISSWHNYGFSVASFVCMVLQIIYLGKFYWWETGYFNTLDITLDRAGFYICWGCIVWVPAFYTFSAYYLASRPTLVNDNYAWLILLFGLASTLFNYWVDFQKEYFRKHGGRCHLWYKPCKFIKAPYKNNKGAVKQSQLLISGFWGLSRHLNYVFEICLAISWSLPTLGYGIWPFLYPIFLTVLLVHRIFRDEKKCQAKYGAAWKEYCEKVPYRLIPGIF